MKKTFDLEEGLEAEIESYIADGVWWVFLEVPYTLKGKKYEEIFNDTITRMFVKSKMKYEGFV